MSSLATLLLFGAGVFFAHHQGLINFNAPTLSEPQVDLTGQGANAEQSIVSTVSDDLRPIEWERALLLENSEYLGSWAKRNLDVTAGLMYHESAHTRNPDVKGPVINSGANAGHRAHGLMQVMPLTAEDLYGKGWNKIQATRANLLTPKGAVYFGTGYLDWLDQYHPGDIVHILRAYNGGPGYPALQSGSANYQQNSQYPVHVLEAVQTLRSYS